MGTRGVVLLKERPLDSTEPLERQPAYTCTIALGTSYADLAYKGIDRSFSYFDWTLILVDTRDVRSPKGERVTKSQMQK